MQVPLIAGLLQTLLASQLFWFPFLEQRLRVSSNYIGTGFTSIELKFPIHMIVELHETKQGRSQGKLN